MKFRYVLSMIVVAVIGAPVILAAGCRKVENLPPVTARVQDELPEDKLFEAVKTGRSSEIEKLLQSNVNVNARDRNNQTPLHRAAQNGNLQAVKLLVQYGADVNASDLIRTPLHYAIMGKHAEMVSFLVDHGVDVNAPFCTVRPYSPWNVAIRWGNPEILRTIVRAGADIKRQDVHGGWPLHLAVSTGNIEFVKVFLEEGADTSPLSFSNRTPLDDAIGQGNKEIQELLVRYGALRSEDVLKDQKDE